MSQKYKCYSFIFKTKLTEEQENILVLSLQNLCENIKKQIDEIIRKTDSHIEWKLFRKLKTIDSGMQGMHAALRIMKENLYRYVILEKDGEDVGPSNRYNFFIAMKEASLFNPKLPLNMMIINEIKSKTFKQMKIKSEDVKIEEKEVELDLDKD
jgi:hypothetical protein